MCSAHISLRGTLGYKFNEYRLKSSGDMAWTRNSRVDPLACDLELESRYLGHVLYTLSHSKEHLSEV